MNCFSYCFVIFTIIEILYLVIYFTCMHSRLWVYTGHTAHVEVKGQLHLSIYLPLVLGRISRSQLHTSGSTGPWVSGDSPLSISCHPVITHMPTTVSNLYMCSVDLSSWGLQCHLSITSPFEIESSAAQSGLELPVYLRVTLNFGSSCLHFSSVSNKVCHSSRLWII